MLSRGEHTYRWSKSGYQIEPIYLHTPERIETYLFFFKIAPQIVVLTERADRKKPRHGTNARMTS